MKRTHSIAGVALASFAALASATPDANELAARMRKARLSSGFELRLQSMSPVGEATTIPTRLAVIGRFESSRRRLSLRGIAPLAIRSRTLAAEYRDGCLRATDGTRALDPFVPLFDTPVVAWDLLSPWWDWPRQTLAGTDTVNGRACTLVRSRIDTRHSPIREVESCVDVTTDLSLRTRLFDEHGRLSRSITVLSTLRQASGRLAARKVAIAFSGKTVDVEAYGGDEDYEVPPDTFAALDAMPAGESPCGN